MKYPTIAIFIVALILFSSISSSQNKRLTRKPDFQKIENYDDLIKKLNQSDKTLDFFNLRMAYTQTPDYKPYDDSLEEFRKTMFKQFQKKNYSDALDNAKKVLDKNYLDPYAHFICEMSYSALKDSVNYKFHNYVRNGLLNSIIQSGDGNSPETAHMVISTREEYFIIYIYGLSLINQVQEVKNGIPVELMRAKDIKTGDTLEIYFNVSLLIDWSDKQLLKKRKLNK